MAGFLNNGGVACPTSISPFAKQDVSYPGMSWEIYWTPIQNGSYTQNGFSLVPLHSMITEENSIFRLSNKVKIVIDYGDL